MSRLLENIPYTDTPDSDYPSGKIRNKDLDALPPVVGSPVVEELYGDIIQCFQKLLRTAGITPNDLPDNESNGYQLIDALVSKINDTIVLDLTRFKKSWLENLYYAYGTNFIISGCVITVDGGGYPVSISAGYVMLNGHIYYQPPQSFTAGGNYYFNTTSNPENCIVSHGVSTLQLSNGTNVLVQYLKDIIRYVSDEPLKSVKIQIGYWNMNADVNKEITISTYCTASKVRGAFCVIYADADTAMAFPLNLEVHSIISEEGKCEGTIQYSDLTAGKILLIRTTGGFFDSANFGSSVVNRGYLTLFYES